MEKAARAARKRALVDMNAHETQEGVMDSLMEALQTGSAFSRPDQRRKRQTRVAGGKFYRTTFIQRRKMKKDQTTRPYMFSNTLDEFTNLTRDCKNITPIEIARRDPNRIMTKLHTKDDSTNFYTPEENQDFLKQVLIDEAKKTPKIDEVKKKQMKHLSRVIFFQKKRSCDCNYTYRTAKPVSDETPKRDVLLKTPGNLESRLVNVDCYSSPFVGESINLARMISPVKERRVIVSKIRKRNSIVRRAISNRRRLHASNTITKRRRLRSASNLQNPSSINTNTPVVNTSVTNTSSVKRRMSNSIDGLHTKILKTASSPIKLLRSKNFENLARYQDGNQIQYFGNGSMNLSLSAKYSSAEQIGIVQSPLLGEMSGVTLLSETSPLHFINTSKSSVKNSNIFKRSKNGSRKKKWKFWQTSINTV